MAWAYFQNQAAFDGYHNAVCADLKIPAAGYADGGTGDPAILNCWTDAYVEPMQLRGQGNVTTWAAHIPDAHLTTYAAKLGLTAQDSQVVFSADGTTATVTGIAPNPQTYTRQANTLTYKKSKPPTWTDPDTDVTYDTSTGEPV